MWNSILCKIQFVNMPYSWIRSFEKNFVDNTLCEKYFVEIIIGESWNINKSFGRNYNFENHNYDRLWNEFYDKKRIFDENQIQKQPNSWKFMCWEFLSWNLDCWNQR